MKAHMTEEEIREEAERRWVSISCGDPDRESITPFDITYTRESILEETRKLAEHTTMIDERAQEMLQDTMENNEQFKASIKQATEEGIWFSYSDVVKEIKNETFAYVRTLDDEIEAGAAQLAMRSAIELLRMATRA